MIAFFSVVKTDNPTGERRKCFEFVRRKEAIVPIYLLFYKVRSIFTYLSGSLELVFLVQKEDAFKAHLFSKLAKFVT